LLQIRNNSIFRRTGVDLTENRLPTPLPRKGEHFPSGIAVRKEYRTAAGGNRKPLELPHHLTLKLQIPRHDSRLARCYQPIPRLEPELPCRRGEYIGIFQVRVVTLGNRPKAYSRREALRANPAIRNKMPERAMPM
jgi:hypothetical protein